MSSASYGSQISRPSESQRSSSKSSKSSSKTTQPTSSSSNTSSSKTRPSSSSNQRSSSSMPHASSKSNTSSKTPPSSSSTHPPSSSKPPRPTQQRTSHSSSKKEDTGNRKKQIDIPAHFHKHKLLTLKSAGTLFSCDGCKEQGCGLRYRCESRDCRYVLHEECAKAAHESKKKTVTATHRFFKGKIFKFLEEPEGRPWICDACRMEVKGFVYHNREPSKDLYDTGLDLHPCCLNLKEEVISDDEGAKITLTLQRNVPKKCVQCKHHKVKGDTRVGGWSYLTSDEKDCFHVSCFKKLILETLQKEGFSDGKKVIASKSNASIVGNNNNNRGFKVAGGRSNSEIGLKIANVVAKTATTVVIKLLFSLIIGGGHPLALLPAFLGLLATGFH